MHLSYNVAEQRIKADPLVAHYGESGEISDWELLERHWRVVLIIFKFWSLRIWLTPTCDLTQYSMPETVNHFYGKMAIMDDDILKMLLAYTFWNYTIPTTSGCPPI